MSNFNEEPVDVLDNKFVGPSAATPKPSKPLDKIPSVAAAVNTESKDRPVSYPEEEDIKAGQAIAGSSVVGNKLKNLGALGASERAMAGAKFGGGVGIRSGGPQGGVIGASIGAVVGRAAGITQSGERQTGVRRAESVAGLNTLGIVDDKGVIGFEDGSSFEISPDNKLLNTSNLTGSEDRTVFEVDATNPLSRRSASVARPLAYALAGLLGNSDPNKIKDTEAVNDSTAVLVNAIQNDADNIQQVYARARELTTKFGLSKEQLDNMYNNIKSSIPEKDAKAVRQGLDTLFVGEIDG